MTRRSSADVVIDYGGELLVVVENKIVPAEATQALKLNPKGGPVSIGGKEIVVVIWRDLLDALIALRERRLVGGAEDALVDGHRPAGQGRRAGLRDYLASSGSALMTGTQRDAVGRRRGRPRPWRHGVSVRGVHPL